jgi:hypothetical protein
MGGRSNERLMPLSYCKCRGQLLNTDEGVTRQTTCRCVLVHRWQQAASCALPSAGLHSRRRAPSPPARCPPRYRRHRASEPHRAARGGPQLSAALGGRGRIAARIGARRLAWGLARRATPERGAARALRQASGQVEAALSCCGGGAQLRQTPP